MLLAVLLIAAMGGVLYGGVVTGAAQGWFLLPSFTGEIITFLAVAHVGLYYFVDRQLSLRPEDFVKVYLGTTVLRILFFGLFIFLLLRLDHASATRNALMFLVSYFLFTALEVTLLYRLVHFRKPPNGGQKEA